jgi:hypothetical protein
MAASVARHLRKVQSIYADARRNQAITTAIRSLNVRHNDNGASRVCVSQGQPTPAHIIVSGPPQFLQVPNGNLLTSAPRFAPNLLYVT